MEKQTLKRLFDMTNVTSSEIIQHLEEVKAEAERLSIFGIESRPFGELIEEIKAKGGRDFGY